MEARLDFEDDLAALDLPSVKANLRAVQGEVDEALRCAERGVVAQTGMQVGPCETAVGELFCGTGRGSASAVSETAIQKACSGPKSPNVLRLVPASASPVPVETGSTTASHQP